MGLYNYLTKKSVKQKWAEIFEKLYLQDQIDLFNISSYTKNSYITIYRENIIWRVVLDSTPDQYDQITSVTKSDTILVDLLLKIQDENKNKQRVATKPPVTEEELKNYYKKDKYRGGPLSSINPFDPGKNLEFQMKDAKILFKQAKDKLSALKDKVKHDPGSYITIGNEFVAATSSAPPPTSDVADDNVSEADGDDVQKNNGDNNQTQGGRRRRLTRRVRRPRRDTRKLKQKKTTKKPRRKS